jgi:hypothetical protein
LVSLLTWAVKSSATFVEVIGTAESDHGMVQVDVGPQRKGVIGEVVVQVDQSRVTIEEPTSTTEAP